MKPKLMPPAYFLILLVLLIMLRFVFPVFKVINYPFTLLGIILISFGVILNLWADSLFKKSNTTVKPHETPTSLKQTGPFHISRHPMYLGMAAILMGSAVICGSLFCFLFPIIFIALMEIIFIPIEEKNLEFAFREVYIDYKNQTRRWI